MADDEWDAGGWRARASCADASTFDSDMWSSPYRESLGRAIWVCDHVCPVKAECTRWAEAHASEIHETVYGGILWDKGQPKDSQPKPIAPPPARPRFVQRPLLPHMGEVRDLLEDGVSHADVAEIFGQSVAAVRGFVKRHRKTPEWRASSDDTQTRR